MSNVDYSLASELIVSDWLNTTEPLSLEKLRGQLVVIYAFQMLCSGCVSHSIPQAKKVHEYFVGSPVKVIALHSVFEHHAAMQRHILEVFIHEYRIKFPVAIDYASKDGPIPQTMQRYQLQGTPSLIIIDQNGRLRLNHFGHLDDLVVGNIIGSLLASEATEIDNKNELSPDSKCDEQGCDI
jgi:peroxiredoxin